MINDYDKQVYAGVLGKVIGVYLGRPVEGWQKADIEKRFGCIDRYIHDEFGFPLVVPDDDITGTLTFIRALEDSGLYEHTPVEFFGETWLNYLIENKTILWWGGMGLSTEHTAYLRLKNGCKAPESGSMKRNGKTVSEQIGAQIFIDSFGLVCPGNPERAAELAEKAARVSHDGEAVYAAKVVAAMISAAFCEKNMAELLDIGVSFIPEDSMIAELHRDVRKWVADDRNWLATFDRIKTKYGYWKYGGNCHVVPNHAVMVMAWAYAPDSFYQSQIIVNTAGWDTDCNAANVGCLMGVKLGLDKVNEEYDFQTPFADRVLLPTAEGSRGVSDVLREAEYLADIGRRVMGWQELSETKERAVFHFRQPGSCHGFMVEEKEFKCRGKAAVRNVEQVTGERALEIAVMNLTAGHCARVSTPLMPYVSNSIYSVMGVSRLYPGMTVRVTGSLQTDSGSMAVRLFIREYGPEQELPLIYSEPVAVADGGCFELKFTIPGPGSTMVKDLGFEINGTDRAAGRVYIDKVFFEGQPDYAVAAGQVQNMAEMPGWIKDADGFWKTSSEDKQPTLYMIKNSGTGVLINGSSDWTDYVMEADLKVHMAQRGGIIVRYQGLKRYIALVRNGNKIQLVKEFYGTEIVLEKELEWPLEEVKTLALKCSNKRITAYIDGCLVGEADIQELNHGGAGFLFENGRIGMQSMRVKR